MTFWKIEAWIMGIALGLFVLFMLYVFLGSDIANYFRRTDFDSETWKKWEMTGKEATLRWDMVVDLQDDYELDGMTEEEIVKLLGEPESRSEIKWTYELGMVRHGFDTGTLSLIFEKGKVTTHRVRAD